MSNNLSELLGRRGLQENLFDKLGNLARPAGTPDEKELALLAEEFHRLAESIGRSVRFVETISGKQAGAVKRVDFFTSHEALHLHYEQALTRTVPRQDGRLPEAPPSVTAMPTLPSP